MHGRRRVLSSWNEYLAVASQVVGRFRGQYKLGHFDYVHPTRLQPGTARRLKRPYQVSVAYAEWGPADAPMVICCGGVASVAMRFNYLASDLADKFRLICVDWVGRGRSGWLAAEGDYSLATYAEQLRQLIVHLGGKPVTVLGSSLGGSAAIELAARHPKLIERLILNDVGPHIPARRRRRRADTLARHYVFRDPSDMLRRIGASQKNDGPVSDDIRFNLTFHQTRWSDEEDGRIYRHDVRALQAYRRDAQHSLHAMEAVAQRALPDPADPRPAVGLPVRADDPPHVARQAGGADAPARHRPCAAARRPQPDRLHARVAVRAAAHRRRVERAACRRRASAMPRRRCTLRRCAAKASLEDGTSPPLLFMRHGATAPNAAGLRCGGDVDLPLTDLGHRQAVQAAQRLAGAAARASA